MDGIRIDTPMARKPDSPIRTRRSLLSRLKNWEDQESWNDFSRLYRGLVYGVARQSGLTDAEAEDVVQETFISVAKKIQGFKYDPAVGSFKSWLLHTTQWRICDQLRKRHKAGLVNDRPPRTSGGTSEMDRVPDPAGPKLDQIWDAEWEKNIFESALEKVRQQVNASQYQLFDLYVVKQWPVKKVAQTLGVHVGRVYLAKHRVSALVRKETKRLSAGLV